MAQQTPIRNQKRDHLLTPQNSVCVFIDYQPEQFRNVTSKTKEELMVNLAEASLAASRAPGDFFLWK